MMTAVSRRASKAPAGADGQQPPQAVGRHDRDGSLRDDRRLHARHRVGEFLFLLQPAVQHAQDLVAGGGGVGAAAAQDVAEEVLQVCLGGLLQPLAAGLQERLGQPGALQVVVDGALRAVLRPKVPLEGAEQRAGGGAAVHGAELAQ
jgi:hypothetical protein